ncbi:MAG TPA: cytochrome c [Candidatus Sulfotelmatobacter sp.]
MPLRILRILRMFPAGILGGLMLSSVMAHAQSDAAKTYKSNCELCHGANGSGDTGPGNAFHAKDLRSDEVQKETDAALTEVINKGRGKMPAFGAKIKPDGVEKLVAYIRSLPAKK